MTRRRRDRGLGGFSDDYFTRWGEDELGTGGRDGLGLRPSRREVPSRGLRPWWWWIARLFR